MKKAALALSIIFSTAPAFAATMSWEEANVRLQEYFNAKYCIPMVGSEMVDSATTEYCSGRIFKLMRYIEFSDLWLIEWHASASCFEQIILFSNGAITQQCVREPAAGGA